MFYEKSRSVKVVFEGQDLPSYVYLWYCRVECTPFIQRVVQCFNCSKFGHSAKFCSNSPLCNVCFQVKADQDHACSNEISCVNCKGLHKPNDKSCPELSRQKQIKELMGSRSMDFHEVASLIPPTNTSYAFKTQNSFSSLQINEKTFPSLSTKTSLHCEDRINKFVPPSLPYVSSLNRANVSRNKVFNKKLNDLKKFSKRNPVEFEQYFSSDPKKFKFNANDRINSKSQISSQDNLNKLTFQKRNNSDMSMAHNIVSIEKDRRSTNCVHDDSLFSQILLHLNKILTWMK